MLDERDEFLISRYADGDLSAGERAHVEALLAESDAARALLREYRQLSGLLRLSRETPTVDFDGMREEIAAAIERGSAETDEASESDRDARRVLRQGFDRERDDTLLMPAESDLSDDEMATRWNESATRGGRKFGRSSLGVWSGVSRRLAMAASLVLALGLAWQLYQSAGLSPVTGVITGRSPDGPGVLRVTGPMSAGSFAPAGSMNVSIGPAPEIAANHPLTRRTPAEMNTYYGRVEIHPESAPALKADPDQPF